MTFIENQIGHNKFRLLSLQDNENIFVENIKTDRDSESLVDMDGVVLIDVLQG